MANKDEKFLPRKKRWKATVKFNTIIKSDARIEVHQIEEVEELDKIVEKGPDWFTLRNIKIKLKYQL